MCYNELTKKSIMNWRELNKEKYNAVCRKGSNKYYIKNREAIKIKNLGNYHFKQEWKRLLAIDV